MKILLVDDHEDQLTLTAIALKSAGFEVLKARNGKEALEVLSAETGVETIFSDVMMPEVDGFDLAYEASRRHAGIRIVLTSRYAPPELPIPDHWTFLPKPYSFEGVKQALAKAH